MGWTYTHKPKHINIAEFFALQFNSEDENISRKIIECKAHVFQKECYMAYEILDKQSGTREVVALVCLLAFTRDQYNFGYKDMDENCGPGICNCPTSILNKLTPTDNEHALEWRAACLKRASKPGIQTGNYIMFDEPINFRNSYESCFCIANAKRGWYHGKDKLKAYKISREYLKSHTWKQINPWKAPKEDLLLWMGLFPALDTIISKRLKGVKYGHL